MKKYILHILIVAGIIAGTSSCKGFLDTTPTDSVVAETAMSNLFDAGVVVNGLYTDIKYYTYYGRDLIYMGDMRADNLYPRVIGGQSATIYTLEYESEANTYFGLWTNFYTTLMRANTLLENIEKLEVESASDVATKNDYHGQALAVRAFVYHDIARLYGYPYLKDNGASLGAVILTSPASPSEAKIPRSTVAETYAQALADLDAALPLLSKSKNTGHFNYWAARLLQARIMLYKGDYAGAYTAATDVINNSPYSLVSNANYLDYWGHEGQDETVLELIVTNQGDIDNDGGFIAMFHHLWFNDLNAAASIIPTKKWRDLFANTPNDVRAQMIQYDDPATGVKKTGEYWLNKFPGNKDRGYTFRRNNPHIFRITEAYLIAAEAGLETGATAAASNYLNAVRKRADPTAANVTATLALVQTERQKEFIGEGHRFFDVMRRGGTITRNMATDEHDYAGSSQYKASFSWDYEKVVLPISNNERVSCPELQQNPGYKN